MNKRIWKTGLLLFIVFFGIHLILIDGYGLTWDFHHHFFAGLSLLGRSIDPYSANINYVTPDPRLTTHLPFGPLMSIAPVTTYIAFWENLSIMPFDNAYNLAIIFSGVTGIVILFFFLAQAISLEAGLLATLMLALTPRYFGDLHNNMKDVPQAATFALSVWLAWRLVVHRRLRDLVVAAIAFAIAFNTKVNTVAVPMVIASWLIVLRITKLDKKKLLPVLLYFPLAGALAFALWSYFWTDPVGQLLYIYRFFQDNTKNIEVLYFGNWYCSGVNVPWHYPFGYLAITTPLPILFLFIIGLIVSLLRIAKKPIYSLLLIWFFVPIARYMFPQMGVIDGIRHFEEVLYPLCAIAAVGIGIFSRKIRMILVTIILILLLKDVALTHPYQISYFNELVGGSKGAVGRFDIDYWGTSQKAAATWINKNVPEHSRVHIVMAADVATRYLRPDLAPLVNSVYYENSDYVVLLNRPTFFYRFVAVPYINTHIPIHTIENRGVPLVWIYDNKKPAVDPQPQWWSGSDPCIRY